MSDNYEQPVEPMSRVEDILRGDATVHTMSRVEALLKELIEAGGGGGGSTVVVTPILQAGTKIANITVNGTGYDIFAPEGSSGSVITIDPEYQSGTLLATLTIDGTEYYIYAPSGGGTTVVANPEGEATDTLEKIQIGNDIYSVEGGGSNGPAYTETSLWSGNDSSTMELSESFQNFDEIRVVASCYISNTDKHYRLTSTWSVSDLKKHINDGIRFGTCGDNWFIYFTITDNTTFTKADQNITYISEIIGIKYGIPASTPFDEEDLWVNPDGSGIGTYTLAHSIDDYDFLAIYYAVWSEYTTNPQYADYRLVSVKDLNQLHSDGKKFLITGFGERTTYTDFNGTSFAITNIESGNTVIKVRGIKLPKGSGGGSESDYTETTLYTNSGTTATDITLAEAYTNYDALYFDIRRMADDRHYQVPYLYLTSELSVGSDFQVFGFNEHISYNIASATSFTKVNNGGYFYIKKIVGVKFGGSGGGIESLADYTWTEILSTNGASGALPSGYNKLLFMAYYAGTVQVYKVIDVAEMKKAMAETNATKYSMSWTWNDHHGNYDTSYFYYDGTNVSIENGYSEVGCKLYGANVSASANSEIIPIAAGTDTTTRTFTFAKTPKKVSVSYKVTDGWAWDGAFIWGDDRVFGLALNRRLAASGDAANVEQIDYGADGKSFTITGHNTFGALNSSEGEGRMYVEY